ncbi:DUF2163 domain-containing protein [Pseudoroseicyclus sp. CXY001]|uniref:DUF2163 domain-containing protein n=1 Tax=Pseudoroseicyclus sp. CXY001 TaxID=3242492 RepID=UPI003570B00B
MSFESHLASGTTTLCRCWDITRADGTALAFTDHDADLSFGGRTYRAASGLGAGALVQATGLATDNAEALGALSDAAISEEDLLAGRYDGAMVRAWVVNWATPGERALRFAGRIGEVRAGAGAFHAELRGLTDRLGQVQTRSFQRDCPAVLGDGRCKVNLGLGAYRVEAEVTAVNAAQVFLIDEPPGYEEGWFAKGRLEMLDGAAAGLAGVVKRDSPAPGSMRKLELWAPLAAQVLPGDSLRVTAGCDKRAETCRNKFSNFNNFRGFPQIPGEDWMMAVPKGGGREDGGSLTGGSA